MDTDYSEEQEALRASLRRFLEERSPLASVRELWDDSRGVSDEVWKGMVELGLPGLLVPESLGGAGGDLRDMGVVLEELGRVVHPGPLLSSAVGAVSAALAVGADDVVRSLADGSSLGALALDEPGARFVDWRSPATRADADGRLTGEKCFVPDATDADWLLVSAGDGLYAVTGDAPGLVALREPSVDGTRRFGRVVFDATPARRLGELASIAGAVDRWVVAHCADGLGAAQAALDLAVAYAKEREQFGRPIGSFQAVAHLCADMLHRVELGRAGLHYALWACDCADAAEAHRAAVMVKAYVSEAFARVGADAIQVFGGAGYSWEFDVHLFYKRLLSLQQCCGTAEEWLEELANLVI